MHEDGNRCKEEKLVHLVEAYQGMLLRMCYVYLKDMEMAKDAVQETFLKAYKTLDSFRGECSEKNWLIQIAVNTCRDMRRASWFRHVDRRIVPEDLPHAACDTDEYSDLYVMCDIMNLPPKLKEVILLHYWQEMRVTEIAQALGVAHSTVSNRLKHAQMLLHDVLDRRDLHERK